MTLNGGKDLGTSLRMALTIATDNPDATVTPRIDPKDYQLAGQLLNPFHIPENFILPEGVREWMD